MLTVMWSSTVAMKRFGKKSRITEASISPLSGTCGKLGSGARPGVVGSTKRRLPMSTLRTPIRREEDYASPHVVKVVVNGDGDALYFSRAPIPFYRDKPSEAALDDRHVESAVRHVESAARHVESGFSRIAFKHLGLYAYRREFLLRLAALPQTALEQAESLEQLRALEHGYRIRCGKVENWLGIPVDVPADVARVEARLRETGRC